MKNHIHNFTKFINEEKSISDDDMQYLLDTGTGDFDDGERLNFIYRQFENDPEINKAIDTIKKKMQSLKDRYLPSNDYGDYYAQYADEIYNHPATEATFFNVAWFTTE